MCGRYFFALEEDAAFDKLKQKIKQQAMFEYASDEIFPSHQVLVMLPDKNDYTLDLMKWGFHGYQKRALINARSETLAERKTFQAIQHKRCLLPCNGFYEWVKKGNAKEKIYIQRDDTPLFYLAGIYNEDRQFVIVTGESEDEMKKIHDRTPIILGEDEIMPYLRGEIPFKVNNQHLCFQVERKNKPSNITQMSLFDSKES